MKLLWIVKDCSGGISLGFPTLTDAETFLRRQSSNPEWLAMWEFRFVSGGVVSATTTERVVLHFDEN